jgi:ArsR family transcriptional regulator
MTSSTPTGDTVVSLDNTAGMIKSLGHPLRLRLLTALEDRDRTVSELQHLTGSSQAMVSQQLAVLRGTGVVTARREGPWVRYTISDQRARRIVNCLNDADIGMAETASGD